LGKFESGALLDIAAGDGGIDIWAIIGTTVRVRRFLLD